MQTVVAVNGAGADGGDPALLSALGYGHFTSMQVRDGRVRGLELHLERLDRSSREMFGRGLDGDRVRGYLRTATTGAGSPDLSVKVTAFSRDGAALRSGEDVEPDVLVTTGPAAAPGTTPLRLRSVEHERLLPHLKHVATLDLVHHWRAAVRAGFDDALFTDRHGRISEASIWNVCFAADGRIVWPDAPALPGITMLLLRSGLEAAGVPSEVREVRLADLGSYDAAFLTNSIHPALPVASIDGTAFAGDATIQAQLHAAYTSHAPQLI